MENKMEKLVALAKRRGFMYPGSDLYGGLANTYDYGPMGTELLRNIKNLWWKTFVQKRSDMVGLDASLISHHKIWEASGHVAGFADAMVDCRNCKTRIRADHLIEDNIEKPNLFKLLEQALTQTGYRFNGIELSKEEVSLLQPILKTKKVEGLPTNLFNKLIQIVDLACPVCGSKPSIDNNWTPVRKFNLLFPVQLGIVEGEEGHGYLRGETAQGMFINFKNIVTSNRVRLPFGIAQLGKSFRNEITPGNSIFRTIEFEQGEIEYFFDPNTSNWEDLFEDWKQAMFVFVTRDLAITPENLRWRPHTDEERSFYSKRTEDLEYNFPFGFKELWGLAYRTNYDLTQHQKFSNKDLTIVDPITNEKVLPHVIEPAVGVNRLMLMTLLDAYQDKENRVFLKLSPKIAPVKAAVFPLLGNKPELTELAQQVYKDLKNTIDGLIQWDDRGNIGKRYLAQDEVGTPFCITIDFQSLEDKTVTVRNRDTAQQERMEIAKLTSYIQLQIR